MKNKLIFPLLLCWVINSNAQTVTINDNGLKTHLLTLVDAAGGGNNDGEVQESEAATLTQLFYTDQGLTDVTGLEAFVNLTGLYLYNNALSSIDLSTLTKLENVDIHGNNLQTLDFSSCPNLSYLQVYENELTSLDVESNADLLTLAADRNDLTAIDVSNNTLLTSLRLFENDLTTIDVSLNTQLSILQVYDNDLTSLDVSTNILLTNLSAMYNDLGTVDLSNNTELTSLSLFDAGLTSINLAANTKLESLYLYDNLLTSLDLTNNVALSDLRLYNNELTSIDLSTNVALTSASFYDNDLTSIDVSQNTLLTGLSVAFNNLTAIDVSSNTELTSLVVSENPIEFLDVSANTKLLRLTAINCDLHSLTIKNGMNSSIATQNFNITGNANLTCVEVDDVTYADANWTSKDAGASFNAVCAPTTLSFSPAKSSSGVPISSKPMITFSEPMNLYSGSNRSVYIYKDGGTPVGTYPSNNPGSNLIINENVLTIDPGTDLEYSTSYNVRINYGALQDVSENDYIGFTSHLTWTFTTEDAPDVVWDGSAWSNIDGPTANDNVVLDENYTTSVNGLFVCKNLTTSSGKALVVDGNHTFIVNGNITNSGSMTVESGASLITYSGKTIGGNWIDVKRTTRYSNGKYSFVGTPMGQATFNNGASIGSTVYRYNEYSAYGNDGLNRWEKINVGTVLKPGQGYAQAFMQELTFTGFPNRGSISYGGSYTEDTDDANEGWNLVSNPYATAINTTYFLATNTNTSGSVYIWDDNNSQSARGSNADYIVANGSMASSTAAGGASRYNYHLGSAQGFFVKLNSAANTVITFNEAMRSGDKNGDDNFFRETQLPIVRINLTDNQGLFKQTVIGLAEDATEDELNRAYDAQAFDSSSDYGLFTLKAGRSLTLNGMTRNWESIQIQLNAKEAGEYQISVELEEYDQDIYLRDNMTGNLIDLRGEAYTFTAQAGIHADRFELLSNPSDVLGLEGEKVIIYAQNGILYIQQENQEPREYQLFNMKGQQLLSTSIKSKGEVNLDAYAKGIYLVFDGRKTHKIILK